ncbi:hypothetical protein SESBI_11828 [Sesbania bispinosa]|nr:hypothetical protein SESBI_11828 [Sesbania bispinosa]
MSRCFPFPPPGYTRNGACSEALIESIKLQREMEKAKKDKKDRKEKKREKKEKRKEKKERKHKEGKTSHGSDADKKFKLIDDIKEVKADGKLQKGGDYENEQLERSGITEELDQPVSSREFCCLSDSTQSSKRKRSTSQSSNDHGPAIKIRIPLRKHREPEESKLEYHLGSSSGSMGIADSFTQGSGASNHQLPCITNIESNQCPGNSDSRHCRVSQNSVSGVALATDEKLDDESRRMASLYNSLLQIPPLTYDGFDSVDQDWLFRSELTEAKPVSKKLKSDSDAFQCSKSLWPRAQYFPEAEIYALPYTVPF